MVQFLVNIGEIRAEEMANHPDRSRLLHALGNRDSFKVDYCLEGEPLLADDFYLLCTDGLWDLLSEREIMDELYGSSDDLQNVSQRILERALQKGSGEFDNLSFQLIHHQLACHPSVSESG